MKILYKLKFIFGLLAGLTLMVALNSFKPGAHNPPTFSLDTVKYAFQINGKEINKTNLSEILTTINHGYRKVEKPNKTLYVFDESGFVVEDSKEGISIMLFYTKGEKEQDPLSVFTGKLILNNLEISSSTTLAQIGEQMPKAEKTFVMKEILLYAGKKFVLSGESKNGILKEIDFGFKIK